MPAASATAGELRPLAQREERRKRVYCRGRLRVLSVRCARSGVKKKCVMPDNGSRDDRSPGA